MGFREPEFILNEQNVAVFVRVKNHVSDSKKQWRCEK
jgi:hypothetical protein